MARTIMSQRSVTWLTLGTLAIIGLLPLLSMFGSTFYNAEGFSLSSYSILQENSILWRSLVHSLSLGIFVALATTFLGIFLALIFAKTTLYGRVFWFMLLLIPLLIPPYIIAYGWYLLLGRESVLGHLLFGFWGNAWILFSVYLPIPILIISVFLQQMNPRLEESALLMSSWREVLRYITLPLISPAIVFSFVLVFILTLGESSVANFLRFDIFPMQSFIAFSAFYDFKKATIVAMPLVLIVLLLLYILSQFRISNIRKLSTKQQILTLALHHWAFALHCLLACITLLLVVIPLVPLFSHTTFTDFMTTLSTASDVLYRSLLYAGIGATLLLFFGIISAYILSYVQSKASLFLQSMLFFFFMLSSVVIGIALILFWNTPYTNFIYATPLIIFFGYVVKYLILSTQIITLKFNQIPYSLIEAAQLSGASASKILWFILLPIAKKALLLAWVVGFIFSLRESTITMLVAPAGSSTLSTYILTQMANGKESTIASLCILMIAAILLPLLGLVSYTSTKEKP